LIIPQNSGQRYCPALILTLAFCLNEPSVSIK